MLTIGLVSGLCFVASALPLTKDNRYSTTEAAANYLDRFGYYENIHRETSDEEKETDEELQKVQLQLALRKFQQFAGLPQTGELDAATQEMMGRKRCGVKDVGDLKKDASNPYKWTLSRPLTYSIDKDTSDLSHDDIRRAMREAFDMWQEVSLLQFYEVHPDTEHVDIRISFGSNDHGDPWPFDGPDGVMAHALYPTDGRTHFDDDETWAYRDGEKLKNYDYSDLLSVGVHEIGHALGLSHSDNPEAIMAAFYKPVPPGEEYKIPQLHKDDIDRIQILYQAGTASSSTGGDTTTTTYIATTNPKEDSTTNTPTTQTRVKTTITTRTYTTAHATTTDPTDTTTNAPIEPTSPDQRTTTGSDTFESSSSVKPKTTKGTWGPLRPDLKLPSFPSDGASKCPNKIDAATSAFNGRSYIFSDSYVWQLSGFGIKNGRKIKDVFVGGPDRVTAAYTNMRTEFTVLLDERQVYGFLWNEEQEIFELHQDYPKTLADQVPFTPEAAFQWRDGNSVLISGKDFATYDEYWNLPTMVQKSDLYFQNLPLGLTASVSTEDPHKLLVFSHENYYLYNMQEMQIENGFPRPLSEFVDC